MLIILILLKDELIFLSSKENRDITFKYIPAYGLFIILKTIILGFYVSSLANFYSLFSDSFDNLLGESQYQKLIYLFLIIDIISELSLNKWDPKIGYPKDQLLGYRFFKLTFRLILTSLATIIIVLLFSISK